MMSDVETPVGGESGGGQTGHAATGGSDGEESAAAAWTAPTYDPHRITAGGRTIDMVEANGISQADQLGTDARYEREQESPGAV